MQISKDSVVSMAYTLTNDEGQVIDTSAGGEPVGAPGFEIQSVVCDRSVRRFDGRNQALTPADGV